MRPKYTSLPAAASSSSNPSIPEALPSLDRGEAGGSDRGNRSNNDASSSSSYLSDRDGGPNDPHDGSAATSSCYYHPGRTMHNDSDDEDIGGSTVVVDPDPARRSSLNNTSAAPPRWAALRRRSSATTPAPEWRTAWTRRGDSLTPADAAVVAIAPFSDRSNMNGSTSHEVNAQKPTTTNDNSAVTGGGGGGRWRDYRRVWDRYPCYRWYLLAHVCQHVGDWFVRVASLLVVERLSTTGAALAHLVWAVMLPKTLVAPLGGYLADRYDRRHLMIGLDVCGAIVVLGYLVALQRESLPLLYLTTVFRSSLTSLYYPATTGIVPLLVPNAADLQLAVTMNGWAWSTMAVLGGTLAGTATAVIGLQACYVIDCATFLLSAFMVYGGVAGVYRVKSHRSDSSSNATIDDVSVATSDGSVISTDKASCGVVQEVVSYLATCGFGGLVVMKASAGFVWGPEDIIGVQYATVRDPTTGQEDEGATSWRTGLLFSIIGIGMLVGPTLSNLWTNGNLPRTIQRASWLGLVGLTLGWLLISLCGSSFAGFLVCTMIRTVGSGMVWVNSTVALQALTEPSLLGRVLALEYTAYTLAEALSATVAGELFDAGLDKSQLAMLGATYGAITVIGWGKYHFSGSGAAQPRFNREPSALDDVVSSLEVSSSILDDMTVSTSSDLELAYIKS